MGVTFVRTNSLQLNWMAPNLEFFQLDRDGSAKGIVELSLMEIEP